MMWIYSSFLCDYVWLVAIHVNGSVSENEEVKFGAPNLDTASQPSPDTPQYARQGNNASSLVHVMMENVAP